MRVEVEPGLDDGVEGLARLGQAHDGLAALDLLFGELAEVDGSVVALTRNVCVKNTHVGLEERGHELGVEVRGKRGAGWGERWWKGGKPI